MLSINYIQVVDWKCTLSSENTSKNGICKFKCSVSIQMLSLKNKIEIEYFYCRFAAKRPWFRFPGIMAEGPCPCGACIRTVSSQNPNTWISGEDAKLPLDVTVWVKVFVLWRTLCSVWGVSLPFALLMPGLAPAPQMIRRKWMHG